MNLPMSGVAPVSLQNILTGSWAYSRVAATGDFGVVHIVKGILLLCGFGHLFF
jgi:hypothetical protein